MMNNHPHVENHEGSGGSGVHSAGSASELETGLQASLRRWCQEGRVSRRGRSYCMHERLFEERHTSQSRELEAEIIHFARERGFAGFKGVAFWEHSDRKYRLKEINAMLRRLQGKGRLVLLNNGRYLSPRAVEEIKKQVRRVIEDQGALSLEAGKAILGYGRTGTVPVLEFLDSIGFTERCGDGRVLKSDRFGQRIRPT